MSRQDENPPAGSGAQSLLGKVPPIFVAVIAQVIALIIVWPAAFWLENAFGVLMPVLDILIVQGLAAALISYFARLPRWWLVLQIALPPAGMALHYSSVPAWLYLAAFFLLVAAFWNTLGERVPLYLTNRRTVDAIDALLPAEGTFSFIDIGCGLASVLGPLSRRHPVAEFIGVESAPLPFALAALRIWLANRKNARIEFGPMWNHSLGDYDIAYCFLSPAPMAELFEKARAEMKPGSLFVSNSFLVPEHAPDETVEVGDRRNTRLHVWRIGGQPETAPESASDAAAGPAN